MLTTTVELPAWTHHVIAAHRNVPFYLVAVLLHLLFVLVFGTIEMTSGAVRGHLDVFNAPSPRALDKPLTPPPPDRRDQPTLPPGPETPRLAPVPRAITTPLPDVLSGMSQLAPAPALEPPRSNLHAPGTIKVPDAYTLRVDLRQRGDAIRTGGGSPHTEGAVLRALNWLKANQNADGSWGGRYRAAMTGLALLTFLAHGETQAGPNHAETVQRGVQWLLDTHQRHKGRFAVEHLEYQHAIATYALAEDYAMTRNSALLPVVEQAVALIVNHQSLNGSWDYGYNRTARPDAKRPGGDTSITGWNVQALKAASNADVQVAGLDAAMKRAQGFLQAVYDDKARRFGYAVRGVGSDALVGVGILGLQFLGAGNSREARGALITARSFRCDWDRASEASSYGWYYITQAMFQAGATAWSYWNREFRDEIVKHQAADGRWPVPGTTPGTSAPDAGWRQVADPKDAPVYHTTLLCMMLEVYYRYLPTFGGR